VPFGVIQNRDGARVALAAPTPTDASAQSALEPERIMNVSASSEQAANARERAGHEKPKRLSPIAGLDDAASRGQQRVFAAVDVVHFDVAEYAVLPLERHVATIAPRGSSHRCRTGTW
jgi:hypothetical protein